MVSICKQYINEVTEFPKIGCCLCSTRIYYNCRRVLFTFMFHISFQCISQSKEILSACHIITHTHTHPTLLRNRWSMIQLQYLYIFIWKLLCNLCTRNVITIVGDVIIIDFSTPYSHQTLYIHVIETEKSIFLPSNAQTEYPTSLINRQM